LLLPITHYSNSHSLNFSIYPYTTLFRSYDEHMPLARNWSDGLYPYVKSWNVYVCPEAGRQARSPIDFPADGTPDRPWPPSYAFRSEEHTSELQSRSDIVCRLLLEKKNRR